MQRDTKIESKQKRIALDCRKYYSNEYNFPLNSQSLT